MIKVSALNIPRWLLFGLALCLAWCVILALDLIPGLRGDFGWRWPYAVPEWLRLLPAVVSVVIYAVVAHRLQRSWTIQCWSFMGAVVIPLACLYLLGDPLYLLVTRTLSGVANGAHLAGTQIADLGETLRDWPQIMPTYLEPGAHFMLSGHIALSPPGLPVFYYLLNQLAAAVPALSDPLGMALRSFQCQNFGIMEYSNAQLATAWFGILMPIWAGLAVFPLFRAGGKLAALWWPLIPSLALFSPVWNTFYPLLAILAYLALVGALRQWDKLPLRQRLRPALLIIVAGILTSLGTFANISIVPFIGFLCLYVLFIQIRRYLSKDISLKQMIADGVIIGILLALGLSSLWLLYYAASGVTPITLLIGILGRHLPQDRPYLPWIYLHLYDLALFTGLPLVLVALGRIFKSLGKSLEHFDPLALALGLTLIILALSGTARGETGRVWLFFVPFVLILAARQVSELPHRAAMAVTVAQVITLITVVAFLRVMDTELMPPPVAPPIMQDAAAGLAAPVRFADSFSLIGQHGIATKDGLDLTLSWRGDQQAVYPYYLSALVVAPNGRALLPNVTWQPFDNNYPITCWRSGQVITETRHLPLGADPASGDYWVSLSAFSIVNGNPKGVTVAQAGAAQDTQIGLGPIPLR